MNSSKSRASPETITQIPLSDLHPFPDHPFSVRDDDSMKDTVSWRMKTATIPYRMY